MVETAVKHYEGEEAYAADLPAMLSANWKIQRESMTEHRGFWRAWLLSLFTFGGMLLSKYRHYHVIYVREEKDAPSGEPSA